MKYLAIFLLFAAVSCSPRINYLGDSFSPTASIDTYYDEADIERDYRVMGLISGDNKQSIHDLNGLKNKMIEEAMARGADGILFFNLFSSPDSNVQGASSSEHVEAKLIKYK